MHNRALSDIDHGKGLSGTANSEIRYSIVRSDIGGENFTLDAIEGVLKVKHPIDFEKLPSEIIGVGNNNVKRLNLLVEARDRGIPSLASRVPVVIYVEDVNDHVPRFEQSAYAVTIPEDIQPATPVLQVRVRAQRGRADSLPRKPRFALGVGTVEILPGMFLGIFPRIA